MSTLTPHQKFALNHYLHSYPSDWSYDQVIDAIYDIDPDELEDTAQVIVRIDYNHMNTYYLANAISEMATSLEFMFPVDNSKQ